MVGDSRRYDGAASRQLDRNFGASDEVLRELLERGADPNWREYEWTNSIFLTHLPRLTLEGLRAFLAAGADVRARTTHGDDSVLHGVITPLDEDFAPRLALLLDAGADVDARNRSGRSVLCHAAQWARPDAVRLLLERGASPELPDDFGNTAIHFAAPRPAVLAVLLEHGADPARQGSDGRTALHVAVERGQSASVAALVAAGCPIDAQTRREGWTALRLAVTGRKPALAAQLVALGADPRLPDLTGVTPLDVAVRLMDPALVAAVGGPEACEAAGDETERRAADLAVAKAEILDRLATGRAFFRFVTPGYKYEADDDNDVLCRDGVWESRYFDGFHGRERKQVLDREGAWDCMWKLVERPGDAPETVAVKIRESLREVTP